MKHTKTQIAVLQVLAGKISAAPFSVNHTDRATSALRAKGLVEYYYIEVGGMRVCRDRLTAQGIEVAAAL